MSLKSFTNPHSGADHGVWGRIFLVPVPGTLHCRRPSELVTRPWVQREPDRLRPRSPGLTICKAFKRGFCHWPSPTSLLSPLLRHHVNKLCTDGSSFVNSCVHRSATMPAPSKSQHNVTELRQQISTLFVPHTFSTYLATLGTGRDFAPWDIWYTKIKVNVIDTTMHSATVAMIHSTFHVHKRCMGGIVEPNTGINASQATISTILKRCTDCL